MPGISCHVQRSLCTPDSCTQPEAGEGVGGAEAVANGEPSDDSTSSSTSSSSSSEKTQKKKEGGSKKEARKAAKKEQKGIEKEEKAAKNICVEEKDAGRR